MTIFHGGCHGCTMQAKKGLGYCPGCCYFQAHWELPDLNDEHQKEKERIDKIRVKAIRIAEIDCFFSKN